MLNAGVQAGCPMSEIMTTTPTRQWQAQAMMLDKNWEIAGPFIHTRIEPGKQSHHRGAAN